MVRPGDLACALAPLCIHVGVWTVSAVLRAARSCGILVRGVALLVFYACTNTHTYTNNTRVRLHTRTRTH